MRYDRPLPTSEKEEERNNERQQNQSVKFSHKGTSEWNKVGEFDSRSSFGSLASTTPVIAVFPPVCLCCFDHTTGPKETPLTVRWGECKHSSPPLLLLGPIEGPECGGSLSPALVVGRTFDRSCTNRKKSLGAAASGHQEIWASQRVKFSRKAVKLKPLLLSLWLHSLWPSHYLWKMTGFVPIISEIWSRECLRGWTWMQSVSIKIYYSGISYCIKVDGVGTLE